MGLFTQINHAIQFVVNDSGFDKDYLMLERCDYEEFSTGLYAIHVTLLSHDKAIDPNKLLYSNATASIRLDELGLFADDKNIRYFNGVITQFSFKGHRSDDLYVYEAQLQSSCSLLSYRKNSRIFKEETVPQIVTKVCKELGEWACTIDDSKLNQGKHQKREVCAQYQETDLAFIIRLLQDDGIYVYFRHEEDSHTMYLADSPAQEEDEIIDKVYRYGKSDDKCIYDWQQDRQAMVQEVYFNSYNPDSPKKDLVTKSLVDKAAEVKLPPLISNEHREVYSDRKDGEQKARQLSNIFEGHMDVAEVHSNYLDLERNRYFLLQAPGYEHLNDKKFLITAVRYQFFDGSYSQQNQSGSGLEIFNSFQCIPEGRMPFPHIDDIHPKIISAQTAIVVSDALDDQGRVEILFRWDQLKNTIRARTQQEVAGEGWGHYFRPHIGQEVLVAFVEGDPNIPIITGCIYNGDNMPILSATGIQTQSVISDAAHNMIMFDEEESKPGINICQPIGNRMKMDNDTNSSKVSAEFGNGKNSLDMTHTDGSDKKIELKNGEHNDITLHEDTFKITNKPNSGKCNSVEMDSVGVRKISHGQHVEDHTGNADKLIKGNFITGITGVEIGYTAGASAKAFFGAKASLTIAADASMYMGPKASASMALKYSYTMDTDIDFSQKKGIKANKSVEISCGSGSVPMMNQLHAGIASNPIVSGAALTQGIFLIPPPVSTPAKNKITVNQNGIIIDSIDNDSKIGFSQSGISVKTKKELRFNADGNNMKMKKNSTRIGSKNMNIASKKTSISGQVKLGR